MRQFYLFLFPLEVISTFDVEANFHLLEVYVIIFTSSKQQSRHIKTFTSMEYNDEYIITVFALYLVNTFCW